MSNSDLTPLRKQYLDIKRQYPNTIVFFRLGDFYETFDADAELAARELEIILTQRMGRPMAGVPHHAVENYLSRLIAKGYHVAIVEQTSTEAVKGLFKREVVRIVTPGTVVEPALVPADRNNYLAALMPQDARVGLAHVDITTGEFAVTLIEATDVWAAVRHELLRLRPAELLLPEGVHAALEGVSCPRTPLLLSKFEPAHARNILLEHFQVASLVGFGIEQMPLAIGACGAIIQYLKETQPGALNLLTSLSLYALDEFMTLDAATRRNLELTETIRTGQVKGSLLGILDCTVTPMGARLLRQWVNQPLLDPARINARLEEVAVFHANGVLRAEIVAALKPLNDLERITNRVAGGAANPRDLVAMRATLEALPALRQNLEVRNGKWEVSNLTSHLSPLIPTLDPCSEVLALLQAALADDPPAVLGKPGVIRSGYSAELDGIINASRHAREWIAGLEKVERERTGIRHLKVSYNKVFGYYIEISRGESDRAPENYIRKQTLVNAERYITPELKEYETLVLNAEVQYFLDRFTGSRREVVETWMNRSGRYLGMIRETLRGQGLPLDLAFTAMIESGYDPLAVSRAGAKGLWQFMAKTARRYGLRVDQWVDERLDPERSTVAAAAHLRDLYTQFGSWTLAQAAYNAGELTVARAVRATGSSDFWVLNRTKFLRRETKDFVPAIQAATIIGRNPDQYGFEIGEARADEDERVAVPPSTDLRRLASAAGISVQMLRALNPVLVRGVTPPGTTWELRVPAGTRGGVLAALAPRRPVTVARAAAPRRIASSAEIHVVRPRDTVSTIAKLYGVSVADVLRWNRLGHQDWIRPGDRLRVTDLR